MEGTGTIAFWQVTQDHSIIITLLYLFETILTLIFFLDHCQVDTHISTLLVTVYWFLIRPKGHQEPRNKVGSQSPVENLVEFQPRFLQFSV